MVRKYIVYAIVEAKNREDADRIVDETSPLLIVGTMKDLQKDFEK